MVKSFIIIFFLVPFAVLGQTEHLPEIYGTDSLPAIKPLIINAAYYGNNIWYPGLSFGLEYIFHTQTKTKSTKKGIKHKFKTHQWIADGNVGFFLKSGNYTATFIKLGVLYRHTGHKGFFWQMGLAPAGTTGIFFVETYEISPAGDVVKVNGPMRWYYAPEIITGIGHQMRSEILNAWFLNLKIAGLIRYNTSISPLVSIEVGFKLRTKR